MVVTSRPAGMVGRWLLRAGYPGLAGVVELFWRFGTVGTLGFLIDTAVVYALRGWLGLYGAGAVSYLVAASSGWALNRYWTFADRPRGAARRQWGLFLTTSLLGFTLNRGCYVTLIATSKLCAHQPVLAVAAGAIAGMGINFMMSHRVVFR